jgi:predicted metal-binding membrane protein
MADEKNRPIGGNPRASDNEYADGGGPSMLNEERHQIAARIARKLRDAGHDIVIVNPVSAGTTAFWRDRVVISLALMLLTALAWTYLLWLSAEMQMGGTDMSGFGVTPSVMACMMSTHTSWRPMEFAFVFTMWTMIMVGTMTPSAAPMTFMYARMGRRTETQSKIPVATAWFVAGYFFAWAAFSLLVTLVQWALERTALLDSAMAITSGVVGALAFIAAGSYQWTRLKRVCLIECQMPFAFLMRHGGFRDDARGSVVLGLRHGAYCIGCDGALMALLFVGGVMNMLWIGILALFISSEKVTSSFGRLVAPIAGTILVVAGTWLFILAEGLY